MPKNPKYPKKLSWKKVALTVGATAIIAGSVSVAKSVINPGEVVTEVIDGDSFKIENGQSIRLYGVDAPELQYCFGKEAKDGLIKKILGKKVILKSPRTDFYKRVQAYVYVDGEFVNEYMAKNGFVLVPGNGPSQLNAIRDSNSYAKNNKLGVFSERCFPVNPPSKNCNIKGQIPYDTGQKIYLTSDCRYYKISEVERYRGEDWFCTEKEAKDAGFVKSPNCP
ncbi:MAG: thermonuclease family protein [Candidatus Woesebacteria bacterium]|nr:thermonuclease family protein [Candidatus Woesebacteria bacterium]